MKTVHEPRAPSLKTKLNKTKTVKGGNLQRRGSVIKETELSQKVIKY